jgi:hypothetical protein
MKTRKTTMNLALGAALAAGALVPATASAWSVNTFFPFFVDPASGGDTLLFPIYTTAQRATTSFSVSNWNEQTVLAKIRFREQVRSMDVLDFYAVLSPYDKFDFWVERPDGDERPTMGWRDNTCVIGPSGNSVMFPPPSPFVDSEADMQLGHLEVLGVASLDGMYVDSTGRQLDQGQPGALSLAAAALHDADGMPADCALLVRTFASPQNVASLNAAYSGSAYDVDNGLVGRYVITGAGVGIEGGGDAIGIRFSDLGPGSDNGLQMTAQSSADCINCTSVYAWDGAEWDHPHLGEMSRFQLFQFAMTTSNIAGDWSNNKDNDVGVDWVLSFPSKYTYLDLVSADSCEGGASDGVEWCLLSETRTGTGIPQVWTTEDTADLCLNDNTLRVFDTEEGEAAGNVNVSPGTRTTLDICNEMQVFTLAAAGDTPRDSVIQTNDRRGVITFENLDAVRGMAEMSLSWGLPQTIPQLGGAVSGILFTTRATEDPSINNGSITDLQKSVGFDLIQVGMGGAVGTTVPF